MPNTILYASYETKIFLESSKRFVVCVNPNDIIYCNIVFQSWRIRKVTKITILFGPFRRFVGETNKFRGFYKQQKPFMEYPHKYHRVGQFVSIV